MAVADPRPRRNRLYKLHPRFQRKHRTERYLCSVNLVGRVDAVEDYPLPDHIERRVKLHYPGAVRQAFQPDAYARRVKARGEASESCQLSLCRGLVSLVGSCEMAENALYRDISERGDLSYALEAVRVVGKADARHSGIDGDEAGSRTVPRRGRQSLRRSFIEHRRHYPAGDKLRKKLLRRASEDENVVFYPVFM